MSDLRSRMGARVSAVMNGTRLARQFNRFIGFKFEIGIGNVARDSKRGWRHDNFVEPCWLDPCAC